MESYQKFLSEFIIEKGVPIPPSKQRSPGKTGPKTPCRYPWEKMQPGDSFIVHVPPERTAESTANNLLMAARNWAVRNGHPWVFTTRWKKASTTVRIWRVS